MNVRILSLGLLIGVVGGVNAMDKKDELPSEQSNESLERSRVKTFKHCLVTALQTNNIEAANLFIKNGAKLTKEEYLSLLEKSKSTAIFITEQLSNFQD